MSVSRRVGAFLCALALILHLAFVPLRARAFAGVLPAVAAGTVVTAFLMASGIYPYEEQKEFAEYVSDNLSSLWSQYLDWRTENSMNPPVTGNELSSLTGYLTQGVVAISRNVWNTLSEFTSWIVSHFSVTDNQTGVELGASVRDSFILPVFASTPTAEELQVSGFSMRDVNGRLMYLGVSASASGAVVARYSGNLCLVGPYSFFNARPLYYWVVGTNSLNSNSSWVIPSGYHVSLVDFITGVSPINFSPLEFSSRAALLDYFETYFSDGVPSPPFSGITADMTTVSPPATLPADTPWRGLAVEGAGTAPTVGAVEQVIQSGVTEREKPEVKVIEVELGANTDVDTETGAVTENPVVVTPESVVPAVSELIAPDSFVGMAVNALQTKFPFCLPFDVVRILQAFVVPPDAPVISLTFHDPFTDEDYSVTVDLSPWNEIAAVCRFMWSILLFVAFSLNVAKMFHIERGTGELFLGNVGSPGV